jgi:hypothetical protein
MKRLTLSAVAFLLISLPLSAQDPADSDRLELIPTKPAQVLPPPVDLPLVPALPNPSEKNGSNLPANPLKKRDSTAAAEESVKERIRIREAKTKAQRDPAIQAEWAYSNQVKTDYEKRQSLQTYYQLLYTRMAKIDPSIKLATEVLLKASLAELNQSKIAPTLPPPNPSTRPPTPQR